MISVSGLGKAFGGQVLFRDATFLLNPGECYGLVGANGSGKTTLLNILGGTEDATEGSVTIPRRLQVGVLRQDHFLHDDEEILGTTLMGNPDLWRAMVEREALIEAEDGEFDADRFSELEEIFQRHDGYTAEARAGEILEGLGFPSDIHRRPLSTLSGGFKLRVLLAQALAGTPDALLLDEPTNHLDILSIRWLEKFLREYEGAIVVISHDHRFLDNIATHILDIDYETVTAYKGNYDDYLARKKEDQERREKELAKREREIAHHRQFVDRFRAKASKARQAQSKLRLIEKRAEGLQPLPVSSRRYPNFRFESRRPSGRTVLGVEGVKKAFGDNEVLHGVDLTLERGDRMAIMGPNGIGKSTLLKIVMGELDPDAGGVTWGYETHPSYFAQDQEARFESPGQTAEDWIAGFCPGRTLGFVRGEMGRVLFTGDDAKKRVGNLSGGEAARLAFCRMAIERPNVLVLDEPTNHLDLESIESLVEALRGYDGTLIIVSHDRWFVSRLATRIVEISEEGIRDFKGSYEEYVHYCGDDHLDVDTVVLRARKEKRAARASTAVTPGASDLPVPGNPRRGDGAGTARGNRNRYRGGSLRKKRDRITAGIEAAESRLAEIDAVFADPTFYAVTAPEEIRTLETERAARQGELDELMRAWEEVETELARRN
ncbi:ABC-F family ATP-binding cassette domain-containing protein [Candidatus Palauibacter sp.]|uniref:ABC-F family ATP-binding cassette domain-containing protein n=1 Tax=Candidatus Palauibacter sp. TaxID=3101350 RepID=UPI003B51EC27